MLKEKIRGYLRPIIASLIWVFVFIKLFIFDVDLFILGKIDPELVILFEYKFLILIAGLSLSWLTMKQGEFYSAIGYITFFPFILILWKFPNFLYKSGSWNLLIAAIDGISSIFVSMKYNFIIFTLFLISFVAILVSSDRIILTVSSSIILMLVFGAYIRRIYFVFKPTNLFSFSKKIFKSINEQTRQTFALQEDLKNLTVISMTTDQLAKWTETLQSSVLYNRVCLFSARKLKNYQKSGLNIVAYIIMVLSLIIITVLAFAIINLALYKIEPQSFSFTSPPYFFTFFYYSFNNLVFSSITEIYPVGMTTQSVLMIQQFSVFFLLAIVTSLIFSFRSQRYTEELDEIIKDIEKEGDRIESTIRTDYNISTVEDAISELEKLKSSSISIILAISKRIK